ncbi:cystathionine beta-lyase [Mesotoga sp. HF07.pep.5.2.highcov]|jgi:cystathionine beta-lyase/cystathionine gamma-synthase|uniref:bifunctional L-alanine/L-glutamate racemase n=1 Tax=Mesotoga sp. HF07.pep.5.2.highcov TaxID=1462923 RepID=UPI000EF173A7|nr:bifunctional L-alanine/L-glutamate racemase [Mesotoga sp. HF07.pep.5.2.highcov]RLL90859.1 cystathionine beta-lyase [Mesotoga sp. HF07.pep.5.2.highcov]
MEKKYVTEILHHLGEDDLPCGAVNPPIFQTSIFSFKGFDEFSTALSDETNHFLYTRGNNPTVNILEEKLAALEHAERAKLFGSGVAAIVSSISAFLKSGDHIVTVKDCYSWTSTYVTQYLARFGVEHTYVEGNDVNEIEAALKPNTKIIYLESPTTFTFKLQDLTEVSSLARMRGVKTIIDNTWATPIYQNPIDFGIDLVVHSASKYLGGNSDVVGGVVAGSDEDVRRIFEKEFLNTGAVPDPFAAWLILRGIRTLHIRMPVHFQNAMELSRRLQKSEAVESVLYPMLESSEQYALAKKQMRGGSGLFSFKLKTRDIDRIKKFVNSLRFFRRAVSWGGYESLISPYAVSHRDPGDNVSLIRIHAGLEEIEVLSEDLDRAMKALV